MGWAQEGEGGGQGRGAFGSGNSVLVGRQGGSWGSEGVGTIREAVLGRTDEAGQIDGLEFLPEFGV